MAQVNVNWTQNPAIEQIKNYSVYVDGSPVGTIAAPPYVTELPAGVHTIEVSASNEWGEGPKSDPIATPSAATKPVGVSISITVNVTV